MPGRATSPVAAIELTIGISAVRAHSGDLAGKARDSTASHAAVPATGGGRFGAQADEREQPTAESLQIENERQQDPEERRGELEAEAQLELRNLV